MAISQGDVFALQEWFKKLSNEEKEKKILVMIKYLVESGNVFERLEKFLLANPGKLKGEELDQIYAALINALYSFALEEIHRQFAHLEKISKMLDEAYKREQFQREKETKELDDLLQNI